MRWGAPSVARFATDAGFFPPALHVATAIALAATGGHDTYDCRVGLPGAGRYVGLWAIDTDRWTDYDPHALSVPANAAQAAYELTERCGGFGWSPVWRGGHERTYLRDAASASTRLPFGEHEQVPIANVTTQHRLDALGRKWQKEHARGR